MANIQNELNNIKNAVYGKDVRDSIHDAIKTCYDDASIVNDNANMEVKIARGVYDTLGDRLNEVDSQLEHKVNNIDFIENLTSGNITQIKLIGDSVTWGADGEGYTNAHSGRLIYDNFFEMNHNTQCYANFFRSFISLKFPSVDFFNAGISGHSAKKANLDKEKWIGTNNSCIILNLGLNDLWECNTLSEFENNYRELIEYTKANTRYLYISTTPITTKATSQNPSGFMIGDINAIIRKISNEYNLPLLDLNNKIIENAMINNIKFEVGDYFYDDDTHPSTKGHKLIWKSLQQLLKFYSDYREYINDNENNISDDFHYLTEFEEGWTVINEEYSYANKKGRVVNLVLGITGGNNSGTVKIGTLPTQYIPRKYLAVPLINRQSSGQITAGLLSINIDGTLYIEGVVDNNRVIVNCSYVI